MKEIRITAKALSPLLVNEDRQSSNMVSTDFIPGSTLRGALAAAYLRNGSPADNTFRNLFLGESAIPNLLPTATAEDVPQTVPLSAYSCKRNPGFNKGTPSGKPAHGVYDMLALQTASRISESLASSEKWECSCKQELKPFAGFWNGCIESPASFRVSKSYNRFTGIDRLTRTVAQSVFYTSQSIDDCQQGETSGNQYFSGVAKISDDCIESLNKLVAEPLFVGADRTRGFGELEISIHEQESYGPDYHGWDKAFREKLENQAGDDFFFSIMLTSHAILVDRYLRPVADLDLGITDCHQVMRIVRGVGIRGWNSAWGLPKTDDTGVKMGSVFLYRYNGRSLDSLFKQLDQIRIEGIGLRREEGFGMVQVDNPIHIIKGEL